MAKQKIFNKKLKKIGSNLHGVNVLVNLNFHFRYTAISFPPNFRSEKPSAAKTKS